MGDDKKDLGEAVDECLVRVEFMRYSCDVRRDLGLCDSRLDEFFKDPLTRVGDMDYRDRFNEDSTSEAYAIRRILKMRGDYRAKVEKYPKAQYDEIARVVRADQKYIEDLIASVKRDAGRVVEKIEGWMDDYSRESPARDVTDYQYNLDKAERALKVIKGIIKFIDKDAEDSIMSVVQMIGEGALSETGDENGR